MIGPDVVTRQRAFDALLRLGASVLSGAGQGGRLSIVIFHRVLPNPDPMFPDEWDASSFDSVCAWLASWFNVLPLGHAIERLRAGALPRRALSITFDDGYADNHDVAMPILRRHGLCATFFIATGFIGGGRMWNDSVVEAVRRYRGEVLDLRHLNLMPDARWPVETPLQRRAVVDRLLPVVKYLEPARRLEVVNRIADYVGRELPADLMMSPAQVRAMSAAGMQIGAHTVNHPILTRIDDDEARREMHESKAWLQETIGQPVTLFAYPNGRPGQDYDHRDVMLAREAGFVAAVTTSAGVSAAGADTHQLPRFTPWTRSRSKFGAQLLRNLRGPVNPAI